MKTTKISHLKVIMKAHYVGKIDFYIHENFQVKTQNCLGAIKMTNSATNSNASTIHCRIYYSFLTLSFPYLLYYFQTYMSVSLCVPKCNDFCSNYFRSFKHDFFVVFTCFHHIYFLKDASFMQKKLLHPYERFLKRELKCQEERGGHKGENMQEEKPFQNKNLHKKPMTLINSCRGKLHHSHSILKLRTIEVDDQTLVNTLSTIMHHGTQYFICSKMDK